MLHALLVSLLLTAPSDSAPTLTALKDLPAATRAMAPKDRPLIIHLWGLWCPPCMEELPAQVELAKRAKSQGIDVLFVSVDEPENAPAIESHLRALGAFDVARQAHIDMEVDPQEFGKALDPAWNGELPATFGFTKQGKRILSVFGGISREQTATLFSKLGSKNSAKAEKSAAPYNDFGPGGVVSGKNREPQTSPHPRPPFVHASLGASFGASPGASPGASNVGAFRR